MRGPLAKCCWDMQLLHPGAGVRERQSTAGESWGCLFLYSREISAVPAQENCIEASMRRCMTLFAKCCWAMQPSHRGAGAQERQSTAGESWVLDQVLVCCVRPMHG
jgi:hypothetical protein